LLLKRASASSKEGSMQLYGRRGKAPSKPRAAESAEKRGKIAFPAAFGVRTQGREMRLWEKVT
jgi:hypothetical protein